MLAQAVLVNGDFIVAQYALEIPYEDKKITCSAISRIFVAARQEEVTGGTLFTNGCPNLNEAAMIIAAGVSKVIINSSPYNSDEMCALELLQSKNIDVITNTRIIM